jgi:hypothetical protein
MHPGYAKPRAELPWLPYNESDKVFVINSHNFGPAAFDPSVNGKSPVAVWCPSRDTAGNGTTTLTDLAGSNNGTLTSMDAATDWVTDTDSGGVRALDFDGVNDHVIVPHATNLRGGTALSVSFWIRTSADVTTERYIVSKARISPALDLEWRIYVQNGRFIWYATPDGLSSSRWFRQSNTISGNTLYHVVCVYAGSTEQSIYINGSLANNTLTGTIAASIFAGSNNVRLAAHGNATTTATLFYACRLDDIRIWNQALDATDVSDLYAAGRGGNA